MGLYFVLFVASSVEIAQIVRDCTVHCTDDTIYAAHCTVVLYKALSFQNATQSVSKSRIECNVTILSVALKTEVHLGKPQQG